MEKTFVSISKEYNFTANPKICRHRKLFPSEAVSTDEKVSQLNKSTHCTFYFSIFYFNEWGYFNSLEMSRFLVTLLCYTQLPLLCLWLYDDNFLWLLHSSFFVFQICHFSRFRNTNKDEDDYACIE